MFKGFIHVAFLRPCDWNLEVVSAFEISGGGNTSFPNNVIQYMPVWNPSELHLLGQLE